MNMGIGFSEILLIVCLVVLFFGTKELPRFMREGARFLAQARGYTDRIRREFDDLSRPLQEAASAIPSSADRKKELRTEYEARRRALPEGERNAKSAAVRNHLAQTAEYRSVHAVMTYVSTDAEVDTRELIRSMLREGKRVVVPYCDTSANLGVASIGDFDRDLAPGTFGILEPAQERRGNFYKSDLQLVICPGVAFDRAGGRLGRGKGYYDKFLTEIRGRIPIIGLAFDCQIMQEPVPFDYHDVPMSEVITESGPKVRNPATPEPQGEEQGPRAPAG
jgi:5-formyltetrahydrofolate cyclo-ligase